MPSRTCTNWLSACGPITGRALTVAAAAVCNSSSKPLNSDTRETTGALSPGGGGQLGIKVESETLLSANFLPSAA